MQGPIINFNIDPLGSLFGSLTTCTFSEALQFFLMGWNARFLKSPPFRTLTAGKKREEKKGCFQKCSEQGKGGRTPPFPCSSMSELLVKDNDGTSEFSFWRTDFNKVIAVGKRVEIKMVLDLGIFRLKCSQCISL